MRKKLVVLMLVVVALLLIAGPALAAGSGRDSILAKQPRKSILSLTGTIVGLSTGRITVDVQMTNKPYIYLRTEEALEILTDGDTIYYDWSSTPKGKKPSYSSFSALGMGDRVSITARKGADGKFTARRVELNKPRYP